MPRRKLRLATDAENREVDCKLHVRTETGKPFCAALKRPYCLIEGFGGPEACKFRKPKEAQDGKE